MFSVERTGAGEVRLPTLGVLSVVGPVGGPGEVVKEEGEEVEGAIVVVGGSEEGELLVALGLTVTSAEEQRCKHICGSARVHVRMAHAWSAVHAYVCLFAHVPWLSCVFIHKFLCLCQHASMCDVCADVCGCRRCVRACHGERGSPLHTAVSPLFMSCRSSLLSLLRRRRGPQTQQ